MVKSRLKQNRKRKQLTDKYCRLHRLHYHEICPMCDEKQGVLIET